MNQRKQKQINNDRTVCSFCGSAEKEKNVAFIIRHNVTGVGICNNCIISAVAEMNNVLIKEAEENVKMNTYLKKSFN